MTTNLVTSKLTLGDIYALEAELNGSVNTQTGEKTSKGIMGHPLSMLYRFHLTDLSDKVVADKKKIDANRDALITKLGVPSENGFTLPAIIDKLDKKGKPVLNEQGNPVKEVNPKFIEFNEEMTKFLMEEREISHYPFTIEALDFTTDESYPVFLRLLMNKSSQEEVDQPA